MKRYVLDTIKNLPGWRTSRKLIVLSFDDYGNIRVASRRALQKLGQEGLAPQSRFDMFDSLENREDLEALFDTLESVKDSQSRPAVVTAFSVPCNIDFKRTLESDPPRYLYETLPALRISRHMATLEARN